MLTFQFSSSDRKHKSAGANNNHCFTNSKVTTTIFRRQIERIHSSIDGKIQNDRKEETRSNTKTAVNSSIVRQSGSCIQHPSDCYFSSSANASNHAEYAFFEKINTFEVMINIVSCTQCNFGSKNVKIDNENSTVNYNTRLNGKL